MIFCMWVHSYFWHLCPFRLWLECGHWSKWPVSNTDSQNPHFSDQQSTILGKINPPILLPIECFLMPLSRSQSALFVNILFLILTFITIHSLSLQLKYFPFLPKGSLKIQLHPSPPITSPHFCIISAFFTIFAYNCILHFSSPCWDSCTRIINHYYLIDYKLHSMLFISYPLLPMHFLKGRSYLQKYQTFHFLQE